MLKNCLNEPTITRYWLIVSREAGASTVFIFIQDTGLPGCLENNISVTYCVQHNLLISIPSNPTQPIHRRRVLRRVIRMEICSRTSASLQCNTLVRYELICRLFWAVGIVNIQIILSFIGNCKVLEYLPINCLFIINLQEHNFFQFL